MDEDAAAKWPELFDLVRQKVKPHRDKANRAAHRDRWWRYGETRPGLTSAVARLQRVLVVSKTTKYFGFVFLNSAYVFSEKLKVFPYESWAKFCVMQSRAHEIWAYFFGGTRGETADYTPTDCFETFAFPRNCEIIAGLTAAGKNYYEFRAALMVGHDEGLTKTYNRFHDPDESSNDILKLRDLHAVMDRVVLDAYGWSDLQPRLDFILDHEAEENADNPNDHKKSWRYRWVDEDRDEILARLLELNRTRAEEEAQSVVVTPVAKAMGRRGRNSTKGVRVASPNLFDIQEPTE
jgi:hypothetical protein